jgi:hypothetical protein
MILNEIRKKVQIKILKNAFYHSITFEFKIIKE